MTKQVRKPKLNTAKKDLKKVPLDFAGEKLKQAGVQPTLQRSLIYQYVTQEADHPTADEVFNWAQANVGGVSLATVYNTLNTLVDAGLLQEVQLPMMEKAVYDHNLEDHFHFFDEDSGEIVDLDPELLKFSIKLPKELLAKKVDLFITGKRQKRKDTQIK